MTTIPKAAINAAEKAYKECPLTGEMGNLRRMLESAILAALPHLGEPVAWPNRCDKSVPMALRFLAENERPIGGEDRFNAEHLYQLADEIEDVARRFQYFAPPAPAVAIKPLEWSDGYAFPPVTGGFYRVHHDQRGWYVTAHGMPDAMAMTRAKDEQVARGLARADYEARIRSALIATPAPQPVAVPADWKLVPIKPTEAMAYAAACAHYGKRRVDKTGIGGISMTVNGIDYSFPHAFRKFWKGALAAAPQSPFATDPGSPAARFGAVRPPRIVRHKKRGSTYEVIGEAEGQISIGAPFANGKPVRTVIEGDKVTVYRAHEDGKLWWRFPDEFEDGRFEDVAPENLALPSAVQPDTSVSEAREVIAVAKAIAEGKHG